MASGSKALDASSRSAPHSARPPWPRRASTPPGGPPPARTRRPTPPTPTSTSGRPSLWAAVSGTLIGVARMLATRRAARYYAKSTGHLPPELQKDGQDADKADAPTS